MVSPIPAVPSAVPKALQDDAATFRSVLEFLGAWTRWREHLTAPSSGRTYVAAYPGQNLQGHRMWVLCRRGDRWLGWGPHRLSAVADFPPASRRRREFNEDAAELVGPLLLRREQAHQRMLGTAAPLRAAVDAIASADTLMQAVYSREELRPAVAAPPPQRASAARALRPQAVARRTRGRVPARPTAGASAAERRSPRPGR
jgi:hypothetical protein